VWRSFFVARAAMVSSPCASATSPVSSLIPTSPVHQATYRPYARAHVVQIVSYGLTISLITAAGGLCWFLPRDGGGLKQTESVVPQQKELVFCSQKKEGVDYTTESQLLMQPNVWSAELCRAECQENPECGAWTWGAARGMAGVSDNCWLKRLEQSERPHEKVKTGVTSGLSCRGQEAACPLQGDVDFQTGKELKIVEGVASRTHCRAVCRSTAGCDAWTWGNASSGKPGLARRCFLKRLEQGQKPREVPKFGVVSGLVCMEALGIGAGAWADASQALPPSPRLRGQKDVTQRTAHPATLFCFTLTRPFGAELELLRMQHAHRSSIFGCEEHTVYSNESLQLAEGLTTHVINVSLDCEFARERSSFLNTRIFKEVWKEVVGGGRLEAYNWAVKVDPDCVFFPDRLRTLLHSRQRAGASNGDSKSKRGVYLSTCWFGMLGPLEVLSSKAVRILVAGWDRCEAQFGKLCAGACRWGEDLFVDQCLSDILGVHRDAAGLLGAEGCDSPRSFKTCGDDSKVAFHPFRTEDSYRSCLTGLDSPENSKSGDNNFWARQQTTLLQ